METSGTFTLREKEDETQETWDLLGEVGSLGEEAPLGSAGTWLSSTAHRHSALGWASSLPSGGRNILLYKMGSLITFGTFNNFSF